MDEVLEDPSVGDRVFTGKLVLGLTCTVGNLAEESQSAT